MSMPLGNVLQSQIIIGSHFPHHPKIDSELIRRYGRAHLDTESIYLLPLVSGNNHNYDGENVIEIRELDISKEYQPFNYVTGAYREFDGITTAGRILCRNLKITSALDEIHGGICEKACAVTELVKDLQLNLFTESPFDPVEGYTVHEITLGPGCNAPGYAGATIGYISTLPVSQARRWANEQPRTDVYIDQVIVVSGVANSSGFALVALLNANTELDNDPIIGIKAYPDTAEVHAKMEYKVISGDGDTPLRRMTLQPSSPPKLFELKNGEWSYIGK